MNNPDEYRNRQEGAKIVGTEEKSPPSPSPFQGQRKPNRPLNNQNLEEIIKNLRQHGYKITQEYDDTGLSKVSGEPPLRKTRWDWVQLILQIIAAVALPIALFFGAQNFSNQQACATQLAMQDQQREAALQSYLDHISDLLLGNNTGKGSPSLASAKPTDDISNVARIKTLAVLQGLDGRRKGVIIEFLFSANLIGQLRGQSNGAGRVQIPPIIDLSDADLTDIILNQDFMWGIYLSGANLSGAHISGDLHGANFVNANLTGADLSGDNLPEADLSGANLSGANLSGANLSGATMSDGSKHSKQVTLLSDKAGDGRICSTL